MTFKALKSKTPLEVFSGVFDCKPIIQNWQLHYLSKSWGADLATNPAMFSTPELSVKIIISLLSTITFEKTVNSFDLKQPPLQKPLIALALRIAAALLR